MDGHQEPRTEHDDPSTKTRIMYKGQDITNEACVIDELLRERKALRAKHGHDKDAHKPFFKTGDYEIDVFRKTQDIFRKTCRGMYERKKARLAKPLAVCACMHTECNCC